MNWANENVDAILQAWYPGEKGGTTIADVLNTGSMDGDEVVELYLSDREASTPVAIRSLQGFKRVHLKAGEKQTVTFTLNPR